MPLEAFRAFILYESDNWCQACLKGQTTWAWTMASPCGAGWARRHCLRNDKHRDVNFFNGAEQRNAKDRTHSRCDDLECIWLSMTAVQQSWDFTERVIAVDGTMGVKWLRALSHIRWSESERHRFGFRCTYVTQGGLETDNFLRFYFKGLFKGMKTSTHDYSQLFHRTQCVTVLKDCSSFG